ncbi:probable E3 ubiquitin-protein ligase RHG1A [Arachis stenosperma]|uniref:probable E3 ubiquitin-protein ligase RHG1A n=1 Tax=Arachis stenosperma TaxID=217475 RepID=UPI0025AD74CB|nr:probable E3 ubiquitin-protein ligase RHG1A [Arachis stenosperma]
MQGQRDTIGSLPETLEFDCGSTSSGATTATVNQQICWNNMRNPADNRIPEYILPPSDVNPSYVSPLNHGWQNLSGWSLGEPSYSNTQNEVNINNDQRRELGWPSSISFGAPAGSRQEERRVEPTNAVSMDNTSTTMYVHGANSHMMPPQNLNLNAGMGDSSSANSHHVEHANLPKSIGPVNEHVPPPLIGSGPLMLPSASNSLLFEDTDGRPGCSVDTRRVSCKRKAVERSVGQCSDGGSSSYSQPTDGSAWNTLPTQDYVGGSLGRSASVDRVSARLGLSMGDGPSESIPDSNVAGNPESFHRNFRLRVNPSSQQSSIPVPPPAAFSTGNVIRTSGITPSAPVLPRFHPADNSLDVRPVPTVDTMIPQSQPLLVHVPALPRNMQSFRWGGASSSANNHSSNSAIPADNRDNNIPHEDASSRSLPRNLFEHPVFAPGTNLRNLARNPTNRAPSSGNLSIPGNVAAASSSRSGSHSAINPSSASPWVARPNPQHYPRRLSEYVRRSLFPPPGSEAGGSSSSNYPSARGPDSRALPSGAHPGTPSWLERPGDHEYGIPYSIRSLAVAGEGNSRLVSELRNVLGLMRRGGSLRFEDVMILDQSVFSGIADIHDRHRDMRLDVDNMSYEELLALEERIGNVSTGLNEETILKLLKQKKHSVETGSQPESEAEPCCVCQEEYKDGEDIGTLDCGHDFHTECVKQWLKHKNLCPICKTTGLATKTT